MALGIWNSDWLIVNAQRRYPLTGDSDAQDNTGSFTIPDDFLVELDLPISTGSDVDPGRFFVKHIGAYASGYSVIIGYQPASGAAINVASALIPGQVHTRNNLYALGGIDDFSDTIGKVVIGKLDSINDQPGGFWTFTLDQTRLEPDVIRPMLRGVSSLLCVNGNQESVTLTGDVEFVAGTNMLITPILAEGADPIIRFSAIKGEGTIETCVCSGDAAQTDPIMRINGVVPTSDGDLTVLGSDCISLEPIENGLRIVDLCAKPCCGCPELERITTDLERFGQQAAAVQTFVDQLRNSVDTMSLVVLGSRLADSGCSTE